MRHLLVLLLKFLEFCERFEQVCERFEQSCVLATDHIALKHEMNNHENLL